MTTMPITLMDANRYRKSIYDNGEHTYELKEYMPVVYQTLISLGLSVEVRKLTTYDHGDRNVKSSLKKAVEHEQKKAEADRNNLQDEERYKFLGGHILFYLKVLDLAESDIVTEKKWNDLIEGWNGEITS